MLIITLAVFGIGAWGWSQMKMKFDPVLLLPGDSYLRKWVNTHEDYYPENGWTADVYSETLNHTHLKSVDHLVQSFENLKADGGLRSVNSWWSKMKEYARVEKNLTSWEDFATEESFPALLSDFLFSPSGATYKNNFIFEEPLRCSHPAPRVSASKFSIEYFFMDDPDQHIPARGAVTEILQSAAAPYTFSHSKVYAAWETDEIIGFELWRNISLAMACVFVVTLILLANLPICLMVLLSVVLTLVDIVGFLHFWDITIDIISCVNIVLAIGLCVDYSVHIGHAYMVATGNRVERAQEAVGSIGLAVLNGGITTFLALVLLGASSSHVFLSFFKVFVLTVVFGLFHGLLLFPSLLATIGPQNRSKTESSTTSTSTTPISLLGAGKDNRTFLSDEAGTKKDTLDSAWRNSPS